MDPSESANIQQYIQLFGHPPPGITPQNLQLIQALQAAKASKPVVPATARPVRNAATPGVAGAIQDAVNAVAPAIAPRSLAQRAQTIDSQVAQSQ